MLLPTPGRTAKTCFGYGPHLRNSPRTQGAGAVTAIPSFQSIQCSTHDIIVPAASPPQSTPVSRMRPTNLASHMRRNSGEEAALAETNGLVTKRRLAANLLYCCGNCALPAWRDFVAVTGYRQTIGGG